ncbi:hypothetical protein DI272_38265 [Streptomyces sp. Act143]|uniref:glycosyltransferase n=1 Tax=Streptomyces sp. Act143 TaxID=2200760 RepID=UPI000D679855|nr:nucleotide disphospho-sugar-binding domain-containing protein [Streptomyces sp. Act143]PWI19355.1 hypothetical protein DI272_38265 [Streptomyces sp. Act143]
MRILFFSTPVRQRLMPMVPLARALRRHGHAVAFSTAAEAACWLEPEGFEVLPSGPDAHQLTAEVARRLGSDILFSSDKDLTAELFAGARVDLMADEALERAQRWAPDLIVCEDRDFVGPLVATALRVPSVVVVAGLVPEAEELGALAAAVRSRYVARGLQPPARVPAGDRLLDLCPPGLQREGGRPSADRLAPRAEPLVDVQGAATSRPAHDGRPGVLVGLDAAAGASLTLSQVLRALSALDVDVMVVAGERAKDLGAGPGQVRWCSRFPAGDWEGVRAVVHSGDRETTLAAAARGVPAVVVAQSPGQEEWAARLAAAGAGIALPAGSADPTRVATAVGSLLSDSRFSQGASRLRADIDAMPDATQVARELVAWASAFSRCQ